MIIQNKVLFALALLGSCAHSHAQPQQVAIAYPMPSPTIDGNLADWPDRLAIYPITHAFGAPVDSNGDFNAYFNVGFNAQEQAIYVAVTVQDDA